MRSVRGFYDKNVALEWKRLVSNPYRKLEFDTTLHFLDKYLPRKGLVLDAGGGPGRYAIELARRGYDVALFDLSPVSLEFAKRQFKLAGVEDRIRNIVKGSIEDMSDFPDASFDSVLCLGPLSHVLVEKQRNQAIRELVRVTKNGGSIFVSVISRLGAIVSHLTHLNEHIAFPFFRKVREDGDYFGQYRFTATHTFLPEELKGALEKQKGVEILEIVGLEGLSSGHEEKLNELAKNKRLWKAWMETHYSTCTYQPVVCMSEHFMIICRRLR